MRKSKRHYVSFLLEASLSAMLLTVACARYAHAQSAPSKVNADPTSWRMVKLQHISPQLMAWWLDPKRNVQPTLHPPLSNDTGQTRDGYGSERDPRKTLGPQRIFYFLPAGVINIFPVESQNSLAVFGTAEGMLQIERILAIYDKPLRWIEIESVVVEVDQENEKLLLQDFTAARANADGDRNTIWPEIRKGFVFDKFEDRLNEFVLQKKANIIDARRVATLAGHTVAIGHPRLILDSMVARSNKGDLKRWDSSSPESLMSGAIASMTSAITVTPTITPGDDIGLEFKRPSDLKITMDPYLRTILLDDRDMTSRGPASARVQQKQAVALLGLPRALFFGDAAAIQSMGVRQGTDKKQSGDAKTPATLLLFVSAHCIATEDDTAEVAG